VFFTLPSILSSLPCQCRVACLAKYDFSPSLVLIVRRKYVKKIVAHVKIAYAVRAQMYIYYGSSYHGDVGFDPSRSSHML
jgi:hypothetical protein